MKYVPPAPAPDWDRARSISRVGLNDVGGGLWALDYAVEPSGQTIVMWLTDCTPGSPDRSGCPYFPGHELVGPLPAEIQNRINRAARMATYWKTRCGAETATTGTRCRNKVVDGGHCHRHRTADPAAVERGGGAQ